MAGETHVEFPPLTLQAEAVLVAARPASPPHLSGNELELRRSTAAVVREVMTQAGTWNINPEFPRVMDCETLEAIADNLHALPPQ
jgi:hypothetical protein